MLLLNKILSFFFLPLGLVMLFLIGGMMKAKRWPIGVALIVLYFSSIPFVGDRLIGWLESRYPAIAVTQVEPADAIVVLGGIFGPPTADGMLPNFSESVERLEAGIILTQAGKAPWLIFTGGRLPWEGRTKLEGEDSKTQAVLRGVPAGQILITHEVGNTADEAQAVAELMHEHQWKRVILVTTGWHMPRAARLFKRAGVDCVIFPVDFRRNVQRPFGVLDFMPSAEALRNTETGLRECYGYAFYALTLR